MPANRKQMPGRPESKCLPTENRRPPAPEIDACQTDACQLAADARPRRKQTPDNWQQMPANRKQAPICAGRRCLPTGSRRLSALEEDACRPGAGAYLRWKQMPAKQMPANWKQTPARAGSRCLPTGNRRPPAPEIGARRPGAGACQLAADACRPGAGAYPTREQAPACTRVGLR